MKIDCRLSNLSKSVIMESLLLRITLSIESLMVPHHRVTYLLDLPQSNIEIPVTATALVAMNTEERAWLSVFSSSTHLVLRTVECASKK